MTSSLAIHPPNNYPHVQPHPHHHLAHPQQMPPSSQMHHPHSYQYGHDSSSSFPRSMHIAPTPNYPEPAHTRPQSNNSSTYTQEHAHNTASAKKQRPLLSEEEEAAKLDSIAAEASSILLLLANNGRPPRRASSPGPQRSNSSATGYDDLEAAETISSLKNALSSKESEVQKTPPSQATHSTARLPHDPTLMDGQKNGISKPKGRKSSGGSTHSKKSKSKTSRDDNASNGSVRLPLTPPFGQQDAHYGGMRMQQPHHPPFPTPTSTPTGLPAPKSMASVHDQPYNVARSPANGSAQLPYGQPGYPGQSLPPSNYPQYSSQHSQMPYSMGPSQSPMSVMAPNMLPPPSSPSHGPMSMAPPPRHMLQSGPPGMVPMQPYHGFQGGPPGPPPPSGYMQGPPMNGGLTPLQQQPTQQPPQQQQHLPPQHHSHMPSRQMHPPQPPSPRSYMNGVPMAHQQHMQIPMAPMGPPMNSSYMYQGPPGPRDGRPPSHSHDRYH